MGKLKKVYNDKYCLNCPFLVPTEEEQDMMKVKVPHMCVKFNKRLFHSVDKTNIFHSVDKTNIVRCKICTDIQNRIPVKITRYEMMNL